MDINHTSARKMWQAMDAKVSDAVFRGLARFGLPEVLKGPSPLTAGLPLIDSPTPQLLCTATYLAMVFIGLCFLKPKGHGKLLVCPPVLHPCPEKPTWGPRRG